MMTYEEAVQKLREMWENGEVPSNFTEDHSEYSRAVQNLMDNGIIYWEDFF